jgi:hypothetical protein
MAKRVLSWIAFGFMFLTITIYIFSAFMQQESIGMTMLIILALFSIFFICGILGTIIGERAKILSGIFQILAAVNSLFFGFLSLVGGSFAGMIGLLCGFVTFCIYIISAILFFVCKGKQ